MEFKDGSDLAVEYEYDKNGNLTKDLNKKITEIKYNLLNLPSHIIFADGNRIEYEYAADSRKVRTTHIIGNDTTTTTYCGNAIYENGSLKMLLNEAGYYSFQDSKFHFYLKDHQGNIRVVADEAGVVEEVNDYYPFGGLMSGACNNTQPYKYNGKELDRKNGLDWYDYGARYYDAALGRWTTQEPFAESLCMFSQYVYCKNNPLNRVDTNGKWDVTVHVYKDRESFGYGFLVATDRKGNEVYRTTVRVEGSNTKENGFNKRNRIRTYADTPTGVYQIKGWSNRLPKLNRLSYGPNDVLELNYISGEAAGLRNGIHLHGGRQEGKGGKGRGSSLIVTHGCLRMYDEDIARMKNITDLLEINDPEESGNIFTVVDDLERINEGPYPRPFAYPKNEDKQKNNKDDIYKFFIRLFEVNPNVRFNIE